MAEIVSIANQKGGVGKTTTSINLAYALATLGQEVLLVDFDPQGNASSGIGINLKDGEKSVYHLLTKTAKVEEVLKRTSNEMLDILPACKDLAGAEVELVNIEGRENMLTQALAPLQNMYKYIIIDCPPSLSLLTLNAMVASNSVITPIQCEYYAMEGLAHFINTASKIKQVLNPKLNIDGGLLTMYDSRMNLSNQVLEEINKFYGDRVYKTPIPRNIRLAEAPSFGQSIFDYDPACRGAAAYLDLAKEFLTRRGVDAATLKEVKIPTASYDFGG
ncbi:ATPases involved in chromosome partitioning [Elusimicrobium minutum Pei191]|uniref:ATPases involved in chromosome partitioning n=1 Tax=Elusimicrobium minutum (strain Pei191) TaxID=445932 RepID=B2KEZ4_ELUMP|nr:ATPases involved in chromosome partitioning [Elusimicrobium minutum Pei191]